MLQELHYFGQRRNYDPNLTTVMAKIIIAFIPKACPDIQYMCRSRLCIEKCIRIYQSNK
jgi:hypothetical protein